MDLPEIRSRVAQYLSPQQLAASTLVCKNWHASFNPVLWFSIPYHSWPSYYPSRPIDNSSIRANAHHIRHLALDLLDPADFPFESCTNITKFTCLFCDGSWLQIAELLRRNTGLQELVLCPGKEFPPAEFMKVLRDYCLNLRSLDTTYIKFDHQGTEYLLDLATRLDSLDIRGCSLTDVGPLTDSEGKLRWPEFSRLEILGLWLDSGMTMSNQLQWIQRCPRLRSLAWFGDERTPLPAWDISELFTEHCPLLEELHLLGVTLTDKNLARILHACPRMMLRQLSRMDQLNFLTVGANTLESVKDGLRLSLDAGLDQLRSLKNLDRFCIDGVEQDMTEEDVRWMLDAWPELVRVEGRLHTVKKKRFELEKILKDRNIDMCGYSDPEDDEEEDEDERDVWFLEDSEFSIFQ
ncbi:hypothetical protein BGX28_004332 [Mortierella sp. GBA30]|nr:hypothetical protein BGX28_004332 [Mortierella sp. GBA30]